MNEPHIFRCITDEYCRGMDDPYRNGVQTFAETGTEVGESCAVGACGTAAGVPLFVPESRFSLMPKLPILSGYLYGNMIGNSAGNAFRADTLQSGTKFFQQYFHILSGISPCLTSFS